MDPFLKYAPKMQPGAGAFWTVAIVLCGLISAAFFIVACWGSAHDQLR